MFPDRKRHAFCNGSNTSLGKMIIFSFYLFIYLLVADFHLVMSKGVCVSSKGEVKASVM